MSKITGIESIAFASLINENKGDFILQISTEKKLNTFIKNLISKKTKNLDAKNIQSLFSVLKKDDKLKNKVKSFSKSGSFLSTNDLLPLFQKHIDRELTQDSIKEICDRLGSAILKDKVIREELEKIYIQILVKNTKWENLHEYYLKALAIFEDEEDKHNIAKTQTNIGDIYQATGEWNKSIGNYSKALESYEDLGDTSGMAHIWGNLGIVQQAKGNRDEAIDSYKKSLGIFETNEDNHGKAMTFNNLGLVYQDIGDLDTANEMFTQSWNLFEKDGDIQGMAQSKGNLSMLAFTKKDHYTALKQFFEILFLYIKIEAQEQVKQASGIIRYITNQMDSNKVQETFKLVEDELSSKGIVWGSHTILTDADVKQVYKNLNQAHPKNK